MHNLLQGINNSIRFGISLIAAFKKCRSSENSAAYIRKGIACRAENFICLCDSQIFFNPRSPYKKIFKWAGYSRERFIDNIRKQGIEATLSELAVQGVYLDIDEFKGRKPVIRPGLNMTIDASDFDIIQGASVALKSSGSRGPGMKTRIGVPGLDLFSSCIPVMLQYMGAQNLPVVIYYPMPSVSGIIHLMLYTISGRPPQAWFSQIPNRPLWRTLSGWKLAALLSGARLAGIKLPVPRYADINHPVEMARWLSDNCPRGAVISTFTGSALHLVHTAEKMNISLPPLYFIIGGEPVTEKKRRIIEMAGHRVFPWYSCVETGRIAVGCLSPDHSDDMHLLSDRVAVVVHPRAVNAAENLRPALLLTALHPDMYKFFLNVETGDEIEMNTRSCGCPWESLGLLFHIHSLQSFEKLTLEGMSIVVDNIFQIVEDDLPERCGGSPVDYQFTEEEYPDGVTRLVLSVSPSVEMQTDKIHDLLTKILCELPNTAFAAKYLKKASAIRVRREFPKLTRSGKILALRNEKKEKPGK